MERIYDCRQPGAPLVRVVGAPEQIDALKMLDDWAESVDLWGRTVRTSPAYRHADTETGAEA